MAEMIRRIYPAGVFYTLTKIGGVAGNTFRESIRQPVILIVLTIALAMIILSPYTTLFTLLESPRMIKEMGLATMLLAGLLTSVFAASSVVSREIEDKTVLSVLAKPVSRAEFVIGKYIGVLATLAIVGYVLTLVITLTTAVGGFEAGALQTVDLTPLVGLFGTIAVIMIVAAVLNFRRGWPFASTAVLLSAPAFTITVVVLYILQYILMPPTGAQELDLRVDFSVVLGCMLLMLALFVIGAIAVAASTRLNTVATVLLCASILLLGLLSDAIFYPHAATSLLARAAYAAVPNLQVFWVGDALAAGTPIRLLYFAHATIYGMCYVFGILFIAMALFEDRQVS
jgi:ABC-2 type transport system permease protein